MQKLNDVDNGCSTLALGASDADPKHRISLNLATCGGSVLPYCTVVSPQLERSLRVYPYCAVMSGPLDFWALTPADTAE